MKKQLIPRLRKSGVSTSLLVPAHPLFINTLSTEQERHFCATMECQCMYSHKAPGRQMNKQLIPRLMGWDGINFGYGVATDKKWSEY